MSWWWLGILVVIAAIWLWGRLTFGKLTEHDYDDKSWMTRL